MSDNYLEVFITKPNFDIGQTILIQPGENLAAHGKYVRLKTYEDLKTELENKIKSLEAKLKPLEKIEDVERFMKLVREAKEDLDTAKEKTSFEVAEEWVNYAHDELTKALSPSQLIGRNNE